MDDCFSQCQSGQFRRVWLWVELGLRDELVPLGAVHDGDVTVNCFAEEWACTEYAISPCMTSVFVLALVQYRCPHQLELFDSHVVDVLNDGVPEVADVSHYK